MFPLAERDDAEGDQCEPEADTECERSVVEPQRPGVSTIVETECSDMHSSEPAR